MMSASPSLFDEKIFSSKTYEDFKRALSESNCSKCVELCVDRHNIVVDRGNPAAKIVLIGEAPGENEDLQGKAFVGRAGQLLDKVMMSIGVDTNRDTLIINVVKCRPPKNRPPKPEESKNCFPYLKWQLEFVKPAVIILLGATAAKYLLPSDKKQNMKDRVGKLFDLPDYPACKLQLLYHPAYLLRDPRKKKDMWEHAQILRRYLLEQGFKLGSALAAIP